MTPGRRSHEQPASGGGATAGSVERAAETAADAPLFTFLQKKRSEFRQFPRAPAGGDRTRTSTPGGIGERARPVGGMATPGGRRIGGRHRIELKNPSFEHLTSFELARGHRLAPALSGPWAQRRCSIVEVVLGQGER